MNGRGGYCVARYGGMSKVDSIMLKFRPIAPKPVASGSGSGGSTASHNDGYVNCERRKRKYVRVSNSKRRSGERKKMKVKTSSSSSSSPPVVTLSLLPETPDRKENGPVTGFSDLVSCDYNNKKKAPPPPAWLSFTKQNQGRAASLVTTSSVLSPPRRPKVVSTPSNMMSPPPRVVSNVTVECVTDTWVDLEGLGCTDEERVINMEKDTCPGFISDGEDNVVWTNKAYKQMAGGDDHMAVVLVRKDKSTPSPVTFPAFTCKVRVTSAAHGGRKTPAPSSPTLTLPCDVWRMERGACAWRLDVKAALSLGR